MKNLLKKDEGFTLVELMVVVAIIGLLSAVALPNFKKYQAKSKVAEAKLQLSAAYTAEQAFFSDYNLYANCLTYMGFNPSNERPSRYYAIGFNAGGSTNPADASNQWASAKNSGMDGTATGCVGGAAGGVDGISMFVGGKGVGNAIANDVSFLPPTILGTQDSTATMTFTIGAAGVIDGAYTTTANSSAITITEQKVISNVAARQGY